MSLKRTCVLFCLICAAIVAGAQDAGAGCFAPYLIGTRDGTGTNSFYTGALVNMTRDPLERMFIRMRKEAA